jgi:hypothetical protein
MPHQSDKRRTRAVRLGLLAVLLLGLILASAAGQGSEVPQVYFFKERSFEIPVEPIRNRNVGKLVLWVSRDNGTYSQVATALPTEPSFVYNAAADGWYNFVVQTESVTGELHPARVDLVTPAMRVCVDTVKPEVSLKAVRPDNGGTAAVQWQVKDQNLDLRTLQLQYRAVGTQNWLALNIKLLPYAQFSWNPPAAGNYEVQLSVADRAGNRATATTQITVATGGPVPQGSSGLAIKHVPSKTFALDYKIDNVGPSKVKHVEVWMTQDTRQWSRYAIAPPEGPFKITVTRAGRYGFMLRPFSGVGRASDIPSVGQPPQLWVYVDDTKPVVKIARVIVGEGKDAGTFTVLYMARDTNFTPKPISIFYSASKDGPWTELLKEQENTGSCRCKTKDAEGRDLPFEFYVKVEATDKAGNKGADQTTETVKIDLSMPTISSLTANPVESAAKPGP